MASNKEHLILSNGVLMPKIGLGTWQATDPIEIKDALEEALKVGYRHLDTAFVYQNEVMIGKVLERWFLKGAIKREDLFVTTKLPMQGVHPARVEQFLDKSLKNLHLDYVDLYLVHFPVCVKYTENGTYPFNEQGELETETTDLVAVWKKMEELLDTGKVRSIGVSNFNISQLERLIKNCKIKPANLQIENHVYLQSNDLIDFCHKNGISVVAYSPLGSPSYNKVCEKFGIQKNDDLPNVLGDETVISLSKKHNKSPAQILLRFLIERHLAVIPKSTNPLRIKENFDIFDFKLDDEDMAKLRSLDKGEKARVCNAQMLKGISQHPEYPFPRI